MRILTTSTGTYLTGDEIAAAVLELWVELANDHRVALVEIPVLNDDAGPATAVQLLAGWGLPVACVPSSSPVRLEDPALVESLLLRAHPAGSYADVPFQTEDFSYHDEIWAMP